MAQADMFMNSRYELVERPAVVGKVLVDALDALVLVVQKPQGGFEVHYGLSCKFFSDFDSAWREAKECVGHDLMTAKHEASRGRNDTS